MEIASNKMEPHGPSTDFTVEEELIISSKGMWV